MSGAAVNFDEELDGLRRRDALVLAALEHVPDRARAPGHKSRDALLVRSLGLRRSMRRLERRGYLEEGWSIDYTGAHVQMTELGKRVAGAAAILVLADEDRGLVRTWLGRLRA